jgi:hypothetical protein
VHEHDEEIRRLRGEGLTIRQLSERLGLSKTYLERAIVRVQIGEEAELERRRETVRASRHRVSDRKAAEAAAQAVEAARVEARRAGGRERAKEWRKANPERHRANRDAWHAAHPERTREIQRESHERNKDRYRERNTAYRDAHETEQKHAAAQWRERNRERRAEWQRQYRMDPEINARALEANRERKRLNRRLEQAGLPPKSVHPSTAKERRTNEAAAGEFFTRPRTSEERRRIRTEYVPAPAEELRRWKEQSASARNRRRDLEAVKRYLATHKLDRVREEVRMDSVARVIRGGEPLDVETEVERRVREAVLRERADRREKSKQSRAEQRQQKTTHVHDEETAGAAERQRRRVDPNTGPHQQPISTAAMHRTSGGGLS